MKDSQALHPKILSCQKIYCLISIKNPRLRENELLKAIKDENAYSVLLILDNHEFIIIDENNQIDFSFEIVRNWWRKK